MPNCHQRPPHGGYPEAKKALFLDAIARVEKYIENYEDADYWGGAPVKPWPPNIKDLKLLVEKAKQ